MHRALSRPASTADAAMSMALEQLGNFIDQGAVHPPPI